MSTTSETPPGKHADLLSELNRDMHRTNEAAGKKRKFRAHPNSIAALERSRSGTQLGGPNIRRCKKCNRVAVRGASVCYWHGGAQIVERRKQAKPDAPAGKASTLARRNVSRLLKKNKVPYALLREPIFQHIGRIAMPHAFGSWQNAPERGERVAAAKLLMREMIVAWIASENGDPRPWADVISKIYAAGLNPPG